ncbi:MAG: spore maturation protein [Paludibacteraceae bacterium]|nr:spore maturation protein [Paludibacteraceae bacterium]
MALNYIWIGLFVVGITVGVIRLLFGNYDVMPAMMESLFSMSSMAFEMTLGLTGMLTLWMGMLKVGEDSGLVGRLAKALSPVLTKLFPDIPKNHPALSSIFMNISANMLGLDNAATPMGLKAMKELQSLNTQKDSASNPMIMFLTINTSGLTIIPISILAYRAKAGAAEPADVFIPLLLTTLCSTMVGLLVVSVIQRIKLWDRTLLLTFGALFAFVGGLLMLVLHTENIQDFFRQMTACILLGVILIFVVSGLRARLNVYDSFIEGAKGGFGIAVSLIPYCVAILVAIGVFRASGALTMVENGVRSIVEFFGINSDFVGAIPVALMKPLNGSGARGMMLECFSSYGPDSFVGHLASIFQGSTDTTFYILAIYFGSVGIKKYRYSVFCGLVADFAGILAAVLICYLFFG